MGELHKSHKTPIYHIVLLANTQRLINRVHNEDNLEFGYSLSFASLHTKDV